VIAVIVADHDVVELLEPCLLGSREDPSGVAPADFEAGVDEH
jgi:hypothetical protein